MRMHRGILLGTLAALCLLAGPVRAQKAAAERPCRPLTGFSRYIKVTTEGEVHRASAKPDTAARTPGAHCKKTSPPGRTTRDAAARDPLPMGALLDRRRIVSAPARQPYLA
jgi:hypothetical protein